MWIVLFILAFMFVLGNALLLLRTTKTPKIPDHLKAAPEDEDNTSDW